MAKIKMIVHHGFSEVLRFLVLLLMLLTSARIIFADEVQTPGQVCGSSLEPCKPPAQTLIQVLFQPYDLTFRVPPQLKWQTNYYSATFYAIILKSRKALPDDGPASQKKCSGYFTEEERMKVQDLFPENKVFASRFGCSGKNAIFYTDTNTDYNFLAVFAGQTLVEAEAFLRQVKAKGFSDANLRKMQVILEYGD